MRHTGRKSNFEEKKVLYTDELKVDGQYCVLLLWNTQRKWPEKMKGHMHFLFFVLRTGCFLKKLRRDSYWRRKHSHKITVVGTLQSPLGLRGELLTTSATQAHHNLFKVCHDCQTRTGPSGWRHISKFLYININPFLSACLWCFFKLHCFL